MSYLKTKLKSQNLGRMARPSNFPVLDGVVHFRRPGSRWRHTPTADPSSQAVDDRNLWKYCCR